MDAKFHYERFKGIKRYNNHKLAIKGSSRNKISVRCETEKNYTECNNYPSIQYQKKTCI